MTRREENTPPIIQSFRLKDIRSEDALQLVNKLDPTRTNLKLLMEACLIKCTALRILDNKHLLTDKVRMYSQQESFLKEESDTNNHIDNTSSEVAG